MIKISENENNENNEIESKKDPVKESIAKDKQRRKLEKSLEGRSKSGGKKKSKKKTRESKEKKSLIDKYAQGLNEACSEVIDKIYDTLEREKFLKNAENRCSPSLKQKHEELDEAYDELQKAEGKLIKVKIEIEKDERNLGLKKIFKTSLKGFTKGFI